MSTDNIVENATLTASAPDCWDRRTRQLVGEAAIERLAAARVLIAGTGGVGGYAAEIIARSGVGHITLIDADCVEISNVNRQLIATLSTLDHPKVILFAERFHDINPEAEIDARREFIDASNVDSILDEGFDYVADAIDTVAPKVELLCRCLRRGIPVISSMGAGGRLDPSKVKYMDLWETRYDGLARTIRQRLRKAGIRGRLPVVASTENPDRNALIDINTPGKRTSLGTTAAVPAAFGVLLGAYVVNSIIRNDNAKKH